MAKCAWCGKESEIYKAGYCEECYETIRNDIKQKKARLEELLQLSTDSAADKAAIAAEAKQICAALDEYKRRKVPFYKSEHQSTVNQIYRNVGIHSPAPARRKGCLFLFLGIIIVCSVITLTVNGFRSATAFSAKTIAKKTGVDAATAESISSVFKALGGDPLSVLDFGTKDGNVIIKYDSPMADDYLIGFICSDGTVTSVYSNGNGANPFYSDGNVNYTFQEGLILTQDEIDSALAHAEVSAKNQLKVPDSAKFDITTAQLSKSWDGTQMVYYVTEDFTAQNALGVDVKGSFAGTITSTDGEHFDGNVDILE